MLTLCSWEEDVGVPTQSVYLRTSWNTLCLMHNDRRTCMCILVVLGYRKVFVLPVDLHLWDAKEMHVSLTVDARSGMFISAAIPLLLEYSLSTRSGECLHA